MFRNVDRMEGGPGDPRTPREWWRNFKGWPARFLLVVGSVFVVAVVYTIVSEAIRG
jgi:hypothetical protein